MRCDKCNGTGILETPEEFCSAELVLWTEDKYSEDKLSCIIRNKDHEDKEYHEDYNCPPCPLCWGIDMHTGWCPDPDAFVVNDLKKQGVRYQWDEDGTYWVVPK